MPPFFPDKLDLRYADCYIMYLRKSEEDRDRQKNSFPYQRSQSERYAEREGLRLAPLTIPGLVENGIIYESHSAFKTNDFELAQDGSFRYDPARPKFGWLLRMLFNKEFKGVVSLCADRFDRNGTDATIAENAIKAGADIRYVQATYDRSGSGRLHRRIDGAFSIYYAETTGDKVRDALDELHAQGIATCNLPLGYRARHDEFIRRTAIEIHPEMGPIVAQLFELYATAEWSFTEIARWATKHGLIARPRRRRRNEAEVAAGVENTSPRAERPVTAKTIEHILHNVFYIGKFRSHGNVLDGRHPALIDRKLFDRVQAVMAARTRSVRYVEKPFFAYRGLLRCPCGRVYTPYEQKARAYYLCRCRETCSNTEHNVSGAKLDLLITSLLDRCSFSPQELEVLAELDDVGLNTVRSDALAQAADRENRVRKLQRDLSYLKEQKLTLLQGGAYSPEEYRTEQDRLEAELAQLHSHRDVEIDAATVRGDMLSFQDATRLLYAAYLAGADHERHELARIVFSELVVAGKHVAQLTAKDGFGVLLARSFGQKLPELKKPISEPFLMKIDVPNFAKQCTNRGPHDTSIASFDAQSGEQFVVSELLTIYPVIKRTNQLLQNSTIYPAVGKDPPASGVAAGTAGSPSWYYDSGRIVPPDRSART